MENMEEAFSNISQSELNAIKMEFSTSKAPSSALILRYASALVHSPIKKDLLEGEKRLLDYLYVGGGSASAVPGMIRDGTNASSPVKEISLEDEGFCLYFLTLVNIRLEKYKQARKWCDLLAKHGSHNNAARKLKDIIDSNVQKEAAIGLGIAGGLVAGAAFLGYTFFKIIGGSARK